MKKTLIALSLLACSALTPAMASDSVGVGLEYNNNYTLGASYTHQYDFGFSLGASVANVFNTDQNRIPASLTGTRFEGKAGQNLNLYLFNLYGQVGLGYEYTGSGNFAYYQGTAGLNTNLSDTLTWNTVKYRYRDSFDEAVGFKTQRLETGVTWDALPDTDVSFGAFHDWNGAVVINQASAELTGVEVGLSHKF
jgi:hypothetical protein